MRLSLRNPAWLVISLMQPILYIVLFGPLLEPLAGQLGSGNAYQIFVPGILVQLGIFGALFVGFGLIAEYRAGVIESQRVTPASRTALLLGPGAARRRRPAGAGHPAGAGVDPAGAAGAGARRRADARW